MLCGNCVAGILVAVSYILKEIQYVFTLVLVYSFFITQLYFQGRTKIKLKFIWLLEQLG